MHALAAPILAGLMWAAAAVASPQPDADPVDPFLHADIAPADVTLFLHVSGASAIRREIADRPMAEWIGAILAESQVREAWTALARAAGTEPDQLFDLSLGERVTLLMRRHDEPDPQQDQPRNEWALLTVMPRADSDALWQRMAPRLLSSLQDVAVSELPEQDLLLARDPHGRVIVGPRKAPALFRQIVETQRGPAPNEPRLSSDPGMIRARALGGGHVGLFMRHAKPMGGWSAAVADLKGDQLDVRHAARFDSSPFTATLPAHAWDVNPLLAVDDIAVAAVAEPTDVRGGTIATFIEAQFGDLLGGPLLSRLGARRLSVIGETEGRTLDPPVNAAWPTLLQAYEVPDAPGALIELDQNMLRLIRRTNRNVEQLSILLNVGKADALSIPEPDPASFQPGEPRCVDVSGPASAILGNFPAAERLSLTWTVVNGPAGDWALIALDRDLLKDASAALTRERVDVPNLGKWSSAGLLNGGRAGRTLAGLGELAPSLMGDPAAAKPVQEELRLLSTLAAGITRCDWRFSRPAQDRMELEVTIQLAPPEATRAEQSP